MPRVMNETTTRYPLYRATGSPRELGRQHGEQARTRIAMYVGWLQEALNLTTRELNIRARRFMPLFQRHCPHLLTEIEGLAEGAGICFEEALASQLRGELGAHQDEGCTTFVIGPRGTADGHVLIGQTSDMPAEIREFCYVLHLQPEDRPEVLMWTFGGMLGYHGLNARGVAHFANSLGGGPAWRFALSHYPLKRMILEQPDLPSVRALMQDVPVCSNGNYVLCDGSGQIADAELTPDGPLWLEDSGEGFLVHSNHYLCAPHACEASYEQSIPDSFPRLERIRSLIREQFGSLTVESLQKILSDHDGYPVSICRHPHAGYSDSILPASGRTVAAIIAEPQRGRMHLACGNPCEQPFIEFRLTASAG